MASGSREHHAGIMSVASESAVQRARCMHYSIVPIAGA